MKFKALRSNCIVRIEKGEEKSMGGIIIATKGSREDMAREEGTLLDCGPDFCLDSATDWKECISIGDRVIFARYGGKLLGEDEKGNELRVLRDIDLLAKKIED